MPSVTAQQEARIDQAVRPSCQPRLLNGGETGILLVHGFTGYPGEMYYLGERLNEAGYTVSIPRLPGHGSSAADFLSTGAADWLRRAADAYLELAGRCSKVYVAGLSMGGALAIRLAVRYPVAGCMLYAPAVAIDSPLMPYMRFIRLLARRAPNPNPREEEDEDRRYLAEEYWRWRYPKALAELWKLSAAARRELKALRCDTLVIVSEKDRSVRLEAAELIERRAVGARVRAVRLKESGHVIVNDCERETAARISIEWLAGR